MKKINTFMSDIGKDEKHVQKVRQYKVYVASIII